MRTLGEPFNGHRLRSHLHDLVMTNGDKAGWLTLREGLSFNPLMRPHPLLHNTTNIEEFINDISINTKCISLGEEVLILRGELLNRG